MSKFNKQSDLVDDLMAFHGIDVSDEIKIAEDECARENDRAKRNPEYITINEALLEHLLNCLANQKYMETHDESMPPSDNQIAIDKAWNEGMEILLKHQSRNIRVIKT